MLIQLCIHSVQKRGERVVLDVGIVGGSRRLKEMKKGGGRVGASERDSERRESEHPSELALPFFLFVVMTACSICFFFYFFPSLISFFHHWPSPFTY